MPIYSRGNHICDRCNTSFDWVCFEISKTRLSSGNFKVEVIPSEAKAYHLKESIAISMRFGSTARIAGSRIDLMRKPLISNIVPYMNLKDHP